MYHSFYVHLLQDILVTSSFDDYEQKSYKNYMQNFVRNKVFKPAGWVVEDYV